MGIKEILVWCTECKHTTPLRMSELDHRAWCRCSNCTRPIGLNHPELVQRRLRAKGHARDSEDLEALREYMTDAEIRSYLRRKEELQRQRDEEIERREADASYMF
jgi:hypothetical protein